jgi:hypothetical protein
MRTGEWRSSHYLLKNYVTFSSRDWGNPWISGERDLRSEFNPTDALDLLDLRPTSEMAPQLNLICSSIVYYYISQVSITSKIQAGQPRNQWSFFRMHKRFVSSSQLQDWLWDLERGWGGSFPRGKVIRAWSWPFYLQFWNYIINGTILVSD